MRDNLTFIAHLLMAVGFNQECGGVIHPDQDMPVVYCYYKPRQWAKADCMDCGWQLVSSNAHGVGVRHAKAHRHNVLVDVEWSYRYDGSQ